MTKIDVSAAGLHNRRVDRLTQGTTAADDPIPFYFKDVRNLIKNEIIIPLSTVVLNSPDKLTAIATALEGLARHPPGGNQLGARETPDQVFGRAEGNANTLLTTVHAAEDQVADVVTELDKLHLDAAWRAIGSTACCLGSEGSAPSSVASTRTLATFSPMDATSYL